jgi:hypothetical protein
MSQGRTRTTYACFTVRQETFHGRFTREADLAPRSSTTWPVANLQEGTMDSSKSPTPTREQKGKTTKTAKDETVELSVEELEERIAPRSKGL